MKRALLILVGILLSVLGWRLSGVLYGTDHHKESHLDQKPVRTQGTAPSIKDAHDPAPQAPPDGLNLKVKGWLKLDTDLENDLATSLRTALARVIALNDVDEEVRALGHLIQKMNAVHIPEMLTFLLGRYKGETLANLMVVAGGRAGLLGSSLTNLLDQLPPGSSRNGFLDGFLHGIPPKNFIQHWEQLDGLNSKDDREILGTFLSFTNSDITSESGVEEVKALLSQTRSYYLKNLLLKTLGKKMTSTAEPSNSLKQLLPSIPPEQQNVVVGAMLEETTKSNSELALSKIAQFGQDFPDFDLNGNALGGALDGVIRKKPDDTAKWAFDLPVSKFRNTVIQRVVHVWFSSEPEQLSQWINTLPVGDNKDTAIVRMVQNLNLKTERDLIDVWLKQVNNKKNLELMRQTENN